MTLLPIFLRLENRPVLVVGAGAVALEKIRSLRAAGGRLTVVAPHAVGEVQALATEGALEWHPRRFAAGDLDGMFVVIAATNDSTVNRGIYEEALRRNVLCNAVDDPPNCDFYFGSVVSRGDLQVAVSTGGKSPALAQRLRREIDGQLPEDLGPWLGELGELREEIRAEVPASEARTRLLHELAQRQVCGAAACPARQWAKEQVEGIQRAAAVQAAEVKA
ncbi:MAG: bifunctional precorrin-2 dehydrogenase/sirohydrochlorin ferrochelatase [Acidobacteriaceae bacterium]